jgi:hypothetical protein
VLSAGIVACRGGGGQILGEEAKREAFGGLTRKRSLLGQILDFSAFCFLQSGFEPPLEQRIRFLLQ